MAEAGWGGVELASVYPWPGAPEGPDFASDAWFALVGQAIHCAAELGLGFDLTFGSGWPFGGPYVQGEARAGTLRAHTVLAAGPAARVSIAYPTLSPGEFVIAAYTARASGEGVNPATQRELAVHPDAAPIEWDVPEGTWRICFVIRSFTGQRVNRCSPGGDGWVHDHLTLVGTRAHLDGLGSRIVQHLGHLAGRGLGAMFCDSWEVLGPHWSPDFPEEFQRRRGYDLRPYLPALLRAWVIADPAWAELLREVRYDYACVLSDLVVERFYEPYTRWCHEHGFRSRVQAHGMPGDVIRSYGTADIPEGEMLLYPLDALRLASSAGHLYGRRIVSSESFTCLYGWPNVHQFAERPDDLKALADGQFACGVNRVLFHGYVVSPPKAGGAPGRYFYGSCHFSHNSTWFRYLPHFTGYLSKVIYLLQQGYSVTDLAVYLPLHDLWHGQEPALVEEGSESFQWSASKLRLGPPEDVAGYTWDWLNDHALQSARVQDARVHIGEQSYAAIVLPPLRFMPLETARALLALARDGAVVLVLGRNAPRVPGLRARASTAELGRLWNELLAQKRTVASIAELQRLTGLGPDLRLDAPAGSPAGGRTLPWWAHRRIGDYDVYFIAHPRSAKLTYPLPYRDGPSRRPMEEIELALRLRAQGAMEIWDAETGERAPCDGNPLRLRFADHESYIVVVSPEARPPAMAPPQEERTFTYDITSCSLHLPDVGQLQLEAFADWRDIPALRDWAGSLSYTLTFNVPPDASRVLLDLGVVEQVAEVFVGERCLGARIWAPYRFDLTPYVRPGDNEARVVVTNLLYNRVQGVRQRQGLRPLPGLRPEEWEQVVQLGLATPVEDRIPSGLLGPVRLIVSQR
jgi:hypothetical protein